MRSQPACRSTTLQQTMKTVSKFPFILFVAISWIAMPRAQSSEVLYSQFADGQSTYGPSELWISAAINSELADDFDVAGSIDRVVALGFVWGAVDFQGVYIRFYAFGADNKPG